VGIVAALLVLALVPAHLSAADDQGGEAAAISIDDAVEVALDHLQEEAADYGVGRHDVGDLRVLSAYTSGHNGVTHVNLIQYHDGLEVFGGHATVNVTSDGEVLFVGQSLVADLEHATGASDLGAIEAVEAAAEALELDEPEGLRLIRQRGGPARETVLSDGAIAEEPISARRGWQSTEDGLRLAWQLVIDAASDPALWSAVVDADTGELLEVDNWTSETDIEALATTLARPGGSSAATLASPGSAGPASTNPVQDGSSYRVFEAPKESPNDGDRTLVTNPADGTASPFGWHDTDGAPGPEFTTTRGNNVHAYTDHSNINVAAPGSDAEGGPSLTFDFPLDLNTHPHDYADAAVTNLFYWCNVAHDVFYLYGFDEPSGNFQVNNYGRGGVGGDDVRCEAQDGGGINNANFATPAADGGRPRMQMYLWNVGVSGLPNLVTVDPPSSAAGTYQATGAVFGPSPDETGVSGDIVLAEDGSGNNEGCNPFIGFPAGAIALVDRGTCPFVQKANNAQAAGAVGMIVANNVAGAPITMGGADPSITIPSVMVSMPDGTTIKSGLPATGKISSNPDLEPLRDGDLEAGIVLHEYSHGVSLRLTGGPGINCLPTTQMGQTTQQAGEGWSDWHGIATLIDPALDDPEGPRGMGTYALWQDDPPRQGPGIRPRPYSRNMFIQPATYDSIKVGAWLNGGSVSAPHGIGHIWAAILWDMTWDLIDKHGFNPNLYEAWHTGGNNLAQQLVMDGLKFQGCFPGFVQARDAIIAADEALTEGENACTLWATFSRRGLGYGAQGTFFRASAQEAFDTHPDCLRGFQAPVHAAYGGLNTVGAGDAVPLRFSGDGHTGLDVLATNSPFSRKVDCDTLEVPGEEPGFVTPRERPIPTQTPGDSGLSVNKQGLYQYPWKTLEEWSGTCRELVLTRADGAQHRAFFRFV
jgi:extracellular elastinolytic metalloproteinase